MTLRTFVEVKCDGCTTIAMLGNVTQPLRELGDAGWTFPVNKVKGEVVQKHYCPVCTRARLVGTV